jgi:VWFA-related protein
MRHILRTSLSADIWCLTLALLTCCANALCQLPAYRSDVSLIAVDIQVSVGGAPVQDLKKEDFQILDNRQSEPVLYCSQDEQPLDVVLLFDISTSMRPGLMTIAQSAHAALAELRKGDRVAAMAFDTRYWIVFPLTANIEWAAEQLSSRIPRTEFEGGTYILQALAGAAGYFKKLPPAQARRRTILVFTDNDGYGMDSPKGVLNSIWEANAVINGVVIPNAETISRRLGPFGWQRMDSPDDINPMVDQTGGETIDASQDQNAFPDMLKRMRKRYTLYYAMPNAKPGEHRFVEVKLTDGVQRRFPQAYILARKGYIVPKEPIKHVGVSQR